MEADRTVSAETTLRMHDEFSDVFAAIGFFKGIFLLEVKDDAKLYQVLLRQVAYALHEPFKKLERLQERQIKTPLGVDKMAEC